MIPLVTLSEFSSLQLPYVAVQPNLCLFDVFSLKA